MKIDISSVLEDKNSELRWQGTHDFYWGQPPGKLGTGPSGTSPLESPRGPLELDLTLTNTGDQILVRGKVKTNLRLSCSSCLRDFSFPMEVELSEIFLPLSRALPQIGEKLTLEELSIFTYTADNFLDVTEAVRQALLLNLPMYPVCRENCKGLCPACGRNLNEGECACPRESKGLTEDLWAPLEDLKKNLPKSK